MYGMSGKLIAQAGKRDQLIKILLRAADIVGQLLECHLYAVTEDANDDQSVWVMEIWDDKVSHDASLKDERVRSLITEAMPLMGGAPEGVELKVVGGHGIKRG